MVEKKRSGKGSMMPVAPSGRCHQCKKPCIAATSESKPAKSEWFCPECHISHYMGEDEAIRIIRGGGYRG